jgi:hypothetical protein
VVGVNSRSLSLTNGCGEQTAHNVRKSLEEEELLVRSAKPLPVNEQQKTLNAKLRGHYQYLRTTHELPRYWAVLSASPLHLAGVAEPPDTWKAVAVGEVCGDPTPATRSYHLGSHMLGRAQGVTPEEPTAGNLHGGVREGRELTGPGLT